MRSQSKLFFVILLGLFMTIGSCVKESEIGQDHLVEPSSILRSNLISTVFDASSFITLSPSEGVFIADTTYLELTNSNFLKDQLSKTNLTFKLMNSLEREFKIDIAFLNDLNEVKFSLQIPVTSGTKEKPITIETKVFIENPEIVAFMDATKLVYKISILPSEEEQASDADGTLVLQSDATYFFDF